MTEVLDDARMAELSASVAAARKLKEQASKERAQSEFAEAQQEMETPAKTQGTLKFRPNGQFAKGTISPGTPASKKAAKLRMALLAAVTPDDVQALTIKLVELGRQGNIEAIKTVFERTIGKPVELDLMEQIERLEATVAAIAVAKA